MNTLRTKVGMSVMLLLFAASWSGCKSVKIESTEALSEGDVVSFVSQAPKGAMVNVTIDLKSIVFTDEKARVDLPDLSNLTKINGWFLYNVNPVVPTSQLPSH